jgi:ABC-type glycerol-3-phosphate transport system substrate-binding protein
MASMLGRRSFLRRVGALGALGSAAVIAACGGAAAPTAAPAKPTEAPKPAAAAPTTAPAAAPTTAPAAAAKPTEAPAAAKPAAAPAGPVNITIHFSAAGRYAEFVGKYTTDVVAKKYPSYKIEVQDSPGHEEHFTKMLSLFAAGRSGDMGYIYPAQGWLGSFSAKGMFADHDSLVKSDNYDLKQFFDGAIKFSRVDGVLRALPWHAHAEHWTWFLNLNAFQEAGVKPPPLEPPYEWTIDQEIDMGTKLLKKSGDKVERFGISPKTDYIGLFMIMRAFGGDLLGDDGKQIRLGEKPSRDAVKWIYDRMYKHKYTPTAAQMEGGDQQMFIAGKLAVLYGPGSIGPVMWKSIGDKFKMGVAVGPNGPPPTGQKAAGVGPNCLGLLNSSKNKDQAWQVLKEHVSQDAGVQKVLFGAGAPGGRPDSYDDPKLLEAFPGVKVVRYQLGFGWPENLPWNLRGREMTAAVQSTLDNVWLNKMTPDEGVDATIKKMEEVLKLSDVRTDKA